MAKPTPSYVKNQIRASLRALVDPGPTKKEKEKIWAYFNHQCAYCGETLEKGHIDHLIPAAQGGPHHISNRVLSCNQCNSHEKLDQDWKKFLKQKISNSRTRKSRTAKIQRWQEENNADRSSIPPKILRQIEEATQQVFQFYDQKVEQIRKST